MLKKKILEPTGTCTVTILVSLFNMKQSPKVLLKIPSLNTRKENSFTQLRLFFNLDQRHNSLKTNSTWAVSCSQLTLGHIKARVLLFSLFLKNVKEQNYPSSLPCTPSLYPPPSQLFDEIIILLCQGHNSVLYLAQTKKNDIFVMVQG